MRLNFSANLNTLFTEFEVFERFDEAKKKGFEAFEMLDPYALAPEVIAREKGLMQCDLINSYPGPSPMDRGYAAIPGRQETFVNHIQRANEYFRNFTVKKIHILSGVKCPGFTDEEHLTTLIENLENLHEFLENMELIGVIEPISSVPNYFMNSFDLAVEVLKKLETNRIKLLLDIYHLHKITGSVQENLEKYYEYAGHIQVSQAPGRREPFPKGEIDYQYVFDFLRKKGHTDYIGLEYSPSGTTEDSLQWMKDFI